ncbi:hypothetical protein C4J81_04890 [Deltaproteobacteria bacterium Smac51]|nr:hypothetical protein C4J81_04890 [Deltaproteobacteria bacterium Smac51]
MNGVGTFQTANSIPGDLVSTLMGGQMQQVDQAMKMVKVGAEMETKVQQQAQAMEVVAMMTGVGGKVNTYA